MCSIGKTKQIPARLAALLQKVEAGELTIAGETIIFAGWEDEHAANRKSIDALVRMKAGNPGFNCKKCGNWYQPQINEWIFHLLCRTCFVAFDRQKERGRVAESQEKQPVKYFEDADEWREQTKAAGSPSPSMSEKGQKKPVH